VVTQTQPVIISSRVDTPIGFKAVADTVANYNSITDAGKTLDTLKQVDTARATPTAGPQIKDGKIVFSFWQKFILTVAMFMKGGLGGAYVPFFTLWLHVHHYSASEVGFIAFIDIVFSILLMPVIGMYLDKWHCHNVGLVLIMSSVAFLKLLYVPMVQHVWVIFLLSALTAPLIKAANSVLDGQVLFAMENKADFSRYRIYGSLGFGFLAYSTGLMVNYGSSAKQRYEYIDHFFYIFAAISL